VKLQLLTPDAIDALDPLIASYPFKAYRHYRVLSRKMQNAVLRAEIAETLAHPGGIVMALGEPDLRGLAVARVLDWETAFFGVPMGRIEQVLRADAEALPETIGRAVDTLRARQVRHISARVDVEDIELLTSMEATGFRLMDALVTYTTRPRKEPPHEVREVGTIRPFRPDDAPGLLEITEEAYRGYKGRFQLDPQLSHIRADAFYVEWARQCLSGAMADQIFVATGAEGRLLGYLAFRRREPVSSAGGVAVFGGGLGACRAEAPGAYAGLIRTGTLWAHEHDGVAECQTQNYNFPVIRIYEAVGAHYVRAEYTLHRYLS
jgi:hypothetical protein